GLITYVLLPPVIILGLILIPIGALRKRSRIHKGLAERKPRPLHIDLSIPTHRNAVFVFGIGTALLFFMTAVGSYKAYHYTESVKFCGITCHNIMTPEYIAYQQSPHAQVKCVDCHIGEGADAYVKYKFAGIRQLYHTVKNDFSKPIPTPVHNLRPAAETCEKCHWPGKFYSSIEVKRVHFPTNAEGASPWLIRMLMHIGREESVGQGIHAHMYIDNEIYYAAEDEQRQEITWVKSVEKDGKTTVYKTPDSKYKEIDPPDESIRKMDCMDCHNRPTHRFKAPYELVNTALSQGKISTDIPKIKSKAMEALSAKYDSLAQARQEISQRLNDYYQNQQAEFYGQNKGKIDQAIVQVVLMYENFFFPEMKTRWDSHSENIGHLWSPGCFRCHDGEHKTPEGKVITRDCTICHTIVEQGNLTAPEKNIEGLPFIHPFEDDGAWQEMQCFECHTGN
ncbi:MAG: NapC/NirT family cytochrome c, partial [Candidatus Omnitrophota bacterium]|nr:NapC/NirT family cytochrome c [Candidatus Omnitrophota bacterium]